MRHGALAQLVEQLTLNQPVPGSSPGRLTSFLSSCAAHPAEALYQHSVMGVSSCVPMTLHGLPSPVEDSAEG
jgi:hypothetical protein